MAVAFGAFSVKRIFKSLASLSNLPDFIEPTVSYHITSHQGREILDSDEELTLAGEVVLQTMGRKHIRLRYP